MTATEPAVVVLEGARKSFGATEALAGIDLRVATGEIVALLGPNGAGKTTCLSVILGLRRLTRGEVRLFGLDPRDERARARRGVMLQDSGLPLFVTAREAIDLFRSYFVAARPRDEVLALAGCADRPDVKVGALSAGQRQRLLFALALAGDPDVIFLDEPTNALDVGARHALWRSIRAHASAGKTVMFTTHDLGEADALATRIVVIDRGRVVADGAPATIKARVPDRRVSFTTTRAVAKDELAHLAITALAIEDRRVHFLCADAEGVLRELLSRTDLEIRELEVSRASLEEAFLSLTART